MKISGLFDSSFCSILLFFYQCLYATQICFIILVQGKKLEFFLFLFQLIVYFLRSVQFRSLLISNLDFIECIQNRIRVTFAHLIKRKKRGKKCNPCMPSIHFIYLHFLYCAMFLLDIFTIIDFLLWSHTMCLVKFHLNMCCGESQLDASFACSLEKFQDL